LVEDFEKEQRVENRVQNYGEQKTLQHDLTGSVTVRGIFSRQEVENGDVQWSPQDFAKIGEKMRERFFVLFEWHDFFGDISRRVEITESASKNSVREHCPERAKNVDRPKT
jgi:hypothetical protein